MSRGLADTGVFVARESGRPLAVEALPEALAVSVITIGELWAGVLAATDLPTRDRRLATLAEALAIRPVPIDEAVAKSWARLRVMLREAGKAMPVNDSWIAATAMSMGVPVVTQDHDYIDVPELEVIGV